MSGEATIDIWSCDGDRVIGQAVTRLEGGRLPAVVYFAFVAKGGRVVSGLACWRDGKYTLDRQRPALVTRWDSEVISSMGTELHAAFVDGWEKGRRSGGGK